MSTLNLKADGGGGGGGDMFATVAERANRFFKISRSSKRISAAPLSAVEIKVLWSVLWELVDETARLWQSSSSAINASRFGGGSFDASSSSKGIPPSRAAASGGGRIKIVVLPKFLSVNVDPLGWLSSTAAAAPAGRLGAGSTSFNSNSYFFPSSATTAAEFDRPNSRAMTPASLLPVTLRRPSSNNGGGGAGGVPAMFVEVSKEFLHAFHMTQRTSCFHADGIPVRVIEIVPRDVARLFLERLQRAPCVSTMNEDASGGGGGDEGQFFFTADDVAVILRYFGEVIGEYGGGRRSDGKTSSSWHIPCGVFGSLRVQSKTNSVEFVAHSSSSSMHGGTFGKPMMTMPRELQLQQRASSSSSTGCMLPLHVTQSALHTTDIAVTDNNRKQPAGVAMNPTEDHEKQQPLTTNPPAPLEIPIELRKYRPSSRCSQSSNPPDNILQQERPYSSATCSSVGPSASERCASSSSYYVQQQQRQAWKAQHRRVNLDRELADIQAVLESRLSVHSPTPTHHSYIINNEDSSIPLLDGTHRSATALAFHEMSKDCHRQPSPAKLEKVMHLAIERHQASLKRKELDEVRMAARRGLEDEAALYARVKSEVIRRQDAEQLKDHLQHQLVHPIDSQGGGGGGITASRAKNNKGTGAPTCIMRPVDVNPFVTPSPGPVRSISALGSKPEDRVEEKVEDRKKRAAYRHILDDQVAQVRADRAAQQQSRKSGEQAILSELHHALAVEKETTRTKKRDFMMQFVEAWNSQREVAGGGSGYGD